MPSGSFQDLQNVLNLKSNLQGDSVILKKCESLHILFQEHLFVPVGFLHWFGQFGDAVTVVEVLQLLIRQLSDVRQICPPLSPLCGFFHGQQHHGKGPSEKTMATYLRRTRVRCSCRVALLDITNALWIIYYTA